MAQKANDFETGLTAGTTITPANSAGGGDAFDTARVGGNAGDALTYENAPSGVGGLVAHCTTDGTTASQSCVIWNAGLGTQMTTYGRVYIYRPSGLTAGRVLGVHTAGTWPTGNALSQLNLNASAVPQWMLNGAAIVNGTSLAADTRYRIEYEIAIDPTTGSMVARIYLGDSLTIDQTVSASGLNTGSTGLDQAAFGVTNNTAGKEVYVDNVLAGETDWPGPYTAPGGGTPQQFIWVPWP